jgi:hypothetical protein
MPDFKGRVHEPPAARNSKDFRIHCGVHARENKHSELIEQLSHCFTLHDLTHQRCVPRSHLAGPRRCTLQVKYLHCTDRRIKPLPGIGTNRRCNTREPFPKILFIERHADDSKLTYYPQSNCRLHQSAEHNKRIALSSHQPHLH